MVCSSIDITGRTHNLGRACSFVSRNPLGTSSSPANYAACATWCMASSLVRTGFVRGSLTQGNGCYQHRCVNNSLEVAVDGIWKVCPLSGGPVQFLGFNGNDSSLCNDFIISIDFAHEDGRVVFRNETTVLADVICIARAVLMATTYEGTEETS